MKSILFFLVGLSIFSSSVLAKECASDLAKSARVRVSTNRQLHGQGATPKEPATLGYKFNKAITRAKFNFKQLIGRKAWKPGIQVFRKGMLEGGELFRKYMAAQNADSRSYHWAVAENLHYTGSFAGSFGHATFDDDIFIMSPVTYPEAAIKEIRTQYMEIGNDLVMGDTGETVKVSKFKYSPMVGISGMSFPQLSAPSIISLLYIQVQMAKKGILYTYNTGEGGAGFHFAILSGDRQRLKNGVMRWANRSQMFAIGSKEHAQTMAYIDYIMDVRDEVFKDVPKEDIARAQIVAQFGSAMNGIKNGEDLEIDYALLEDIASNPNVVMVQYKLKQAAKRGARVDAKKMDHLTQTIRRLKMEGSDKSPANHPDFADYESRARLIIATKLATKKPVSLKFGVGDVQDMYAFLAYLDAKGALPDHIQIDGSDDHFSPGSGNAMPYGDSSLPGDEAVIVVDGILKKLGVRDQVFVEATGGTLLPQKGIEKLALGADGVAAARLWMSMGLGCVGVKRCKDGDCPYGIAARNNSMLAASMDPKVVTARGIAAAEQWFTNYTLWFGEAGSTDWRTFRKTHGLSAPVSRLRKKSGDYMIQLRNTYSIEKLMDLFEGVLSRDEILSLIFGGVPPEPVDLPTRISLPQLDRRD